MEASACHVTQAKAGCPCLHVVSVHEMNLWTELRQAPGISLLSRAQVLKITRKSQVLENVSEDQSIHTNPSPPPKIITPTDRRLRSLPHHKQQAALSVPGGKGSSEIVAKTEALPSDFMELLLSTEGRQIVGNIILDIHTLDVNYPRYAYPRYNITLDIDLIYSFR